MTVSVRSWTLSITTLGTAIGQRKYNTRIVFYAAIDTKK